MGNQALQDHSDLGFVPVQDHSDLGFVPEQKQSGAQSGVDSALDSGNALLQSYGNKASGSNLPYLQAIGEKAIPILFPGGVGRDVDKDLARRGFKVVEQDPGLDDLTNKNRQNLRDLQERNPSATLAGNLLGYGGQGLLMSQVAPISAETALGRIAQAAKGGAILGAIQSPDPDVKESVMGAIPTGGAQPVRRTEQALIGAGIGAGLQGTFGEGLNWVGTKIAARMAGVPTKGAEIYGERGSEVKDLVKKEGGVLPAAADQMKQDVFNHVKAAKEGMSDLIEGTLKQSDGQAPSHPIGNIVNRLDQTKDKLDPYWDDKAISAIDDIKDKLLLSADKNGMTDLRGLMKAREYLRSVAEWDVPETSELFQGSSSVTRKYVQSAARGADKMATEMLHGASPQIGYADGFLKDLHNVNNQMSKALLSQGGAENAFASAGGGQGNANQMMLQKLDEMTGSHAMDDAELLYAAKAMKNDSFVEHPRQQLLKLGLDIKRGAAPLATPALYGSTGLIETPIENKYLPKSAVERRLAGQKQ